MGVEVRSKLGNSVSRSLSGSSLIGDGMLVRLRSSTLAILGFVAAVGLAMVAAVSQQGWPDVLTGPLPQAPSADFARNDPIAAPVDAFAPPPVFAGIERSPRDRPKRRPGSSNAVAASKLTGARQVAAAPSEPAPAAPTATPEPVAAAPAPPAAASAPTPNATQTTANVGSQAGGGSSPVTAGVGQPSGGSDQDQVGQDDPGPPSWAGNDDHDHGWGADDRNDDDWGDDDRNRWSDDDDWDDDNDFDHGHGNDDRGGWGRH